MSETKRIKTALVSVYHKEGLDEIITKLHEEGVEFLSTGGTRQFIESLGYPCKAVEDLTTYPSILGGRVKTLHPKVFGGCLLYTSDAADELDGVDLGGRRIIKKKFFQAEDGIRDQPRSRGLGDVYKRQGLSQSAETPRRLKSSRCLSTCESA